MARTFTSAGTSYAETTGVYVASAPLTLACWFNAANITANHDILGCYNEGTAAIHAFFISAAGAYADDPIHAITVAYGSHAIAKSGSGFSASTWTHAAGVFNSAASRYAYINGTPGSEETTSKTPVGVDRSRLALYRSGGVNYYSNASIAEAAIWNVALSADEITALADGWAPLLIRPASLVVYWPLVGYSSPEVAVKGSSITLYNTPAAAAHPRMIYSRRHRIYVPAAAVTAVTRTPGAGSMSLAGVPPAARVDHLRTTGSGSMSWQGYAPAVVIGFVLQTSLGALALSGAAPTVVAASVRTPAAGTLTLAGLAPTVVELEPGLVQPGVGSLVLAGQAPTVLEAHTRATGAGSLTVAGLTPSLSEGAVLTPGTDTLTLSGLAPTVETVTGVALRPGVGTIVLQGYSPPLLRTFLAQPGIGTLTLTGLVPTAWQTVPVPFTLQVQVEGRDFWDPSVRAFQLWSPSVSDPESEVL